jgi:hypothetical protein
VGSSTTLLTLPKPFSYEYGYLCFKIFTISLGICLLERSHKLETTITDMMSEPKADLLLVLSLHVSLLVCDEIRAAGGGDRCDLILGWVRLDDHGQQDSLVPKSDVTSLLTLLWNDRKFFLKALISTHSPGLSAVIFLLWRYWNQER